MAALLEILLTIFTGISTIIAVIAFWHTYTVSKVRGPQFNFTEARTVDRKHTELEKDLVYVNVLVQNIGDRMGFLRWEKVRIEVRNQRIEAHTPQKPWECPVQPDNQTSKQFSFIITKDFDLSDGVFTAEGVYSSLEGKMIEETFATPLIGQFLKPLPMEQA